jgi:AcrR family transcriptional regulator
MSTGKRKTTKGDRTRAKIYAIAKELFTRYGYEKVSVEAIVREAGVAKGTFYIYFETKATLFTTIIAEEVNGLDIDYQAYVDSFPADTSATALLFALTGKIIEIISGEIGYDTIRRVYIEQLEKTADLVGVSDYNRGVYTIVRSVIEKGVLQGEFREGLDAVVITRHCVLALRGLAYEWCIRWPDFDFKEQGLAHFKILLEGFRK